AGALAVPTTSSSSAAVLLPWKDSLGSWGDSGGFTCPVNPIPEWNLPGCGKESRARDTKCEACGRVLRVDWQVGASAAIGSGVDNPELKLAGVVTFQSKSGITYRGKVVAIDPRPGPDAPRGVARVKYDDWPYDKYDEDVKMEMVTPIGWVPTPVGRAGRRASKPPVPFTPNTEGYYRRKPAQPALAEEIVVKDEEREMREGGFGSESGPEDDSGD
ncbi:unnamed protein product, partial [Scytosiphon promiscuus]